MGSGNEVSPVFYSSGDYFSTVASYIHLNPARANMINRETGKLSDYRWSSYPFFANHLNDRIGFLSTEYWLVWV